MCIKTIAQQINLNDEHVTVFREEVFTQIGFSINSGLKKKVSVFTYWFTLV